MVFVPDAKALVLKGLMEIGFYAPKMEDSKTTAGDLSGIKFKNTDGKILNLGELKGKVIFLNFWATWCPPCRAEMPALNKLYNQFMGNKDIVFVFVDTDGDLNKSVKFMQNRKFQLPVYKVDSEIPEQIFAGSLPTTIIFDKEGRLSFKHEGIANYKDEKFVEFLNKLINY